MKRKKFAYLQLPNGTGTSTDSFTATPVRNNEGSKKKKKKKGKQLNGVTPITEESICVVEGKGKMGNKLSFPKLSVKKKSKAYTE